MHRLMVLLGTVVLCLVGLAAPVFAASPLLPPTGSGGGDICGGLQGVVVPVTSAGPDASALPTIPAGHWVAVGHADAGIQLCGTTSKGGSNIDDIATSFMAGMLSVLIVVVALQWSSYRRRGQAHDRVNAA